MKLGIALFALALTLAGSLHAQTPAPTPLFTVSSQAVAIRLAGQTTPGTDIVGAFNLTNNIILQSDNILAPGISLQAYLGGIRYNIGLAKIIAKTKIPANTFQPYIHGALGVVRNVPASGATLQHYSALAGAGFDYDPLGTGKFSFGPRVEYFDAPGFGKSPRGVAVSMNLSFVLGSK